jgi:hypothetical protein
MPNKFIYISLYAILFEKEKKRPPIMSAFCEAAWYDDTGAKKRPKGKYVSRVPKKSKGREQTALTQNRNTMGL